MTFSTCDITTFVIGGTKLAIFMLAFTEILKSHISEIYMDINPIRPLEGGGGGGGGITKFLRSFSCSDLTLKIEYFIVR